MYLVKMQIIQSHKSLLKITSQVEMVLSKINTQYVEDFYTSFRKTDTLCYEAVTAKGIYLLEIIDKIRFSLPDIVLHFGIGFVETLPDDSFNLSKGVSLANDALEVLRSHDDYGNSHVQFNLGRKNSFESLINESLRLSDFVISRWRRSQYKLVTYLIVNYGLMDTFVQKEVAGVMKMSPQNLNQQLKNSGYYNLIRLKRELTVVLEQFRRAA